jgi:hypothetical protein
VTVRFEVIPTQQREEELARPRVREREPELHRRLDPLGALESLPDASPCFSGGDALALRCRPREQRLDAGELLSQLGLVHDARSRAT